MDVQTQVFDYSQEEAAMESLAKAQEYKNALANVHAVVASLYREISNIDIAVKKNIQTNEDLLGAFKNDALGMYPQMSSQELEATISQISQNHPLYPIWSKYDKAISEVNSAIKERLRERESLSLQYDEAIRRQDGILDEYQIFYDTSAYPVPTKAELADQLEQEALIPYVEEGSTIADLPAIERLNPVAADFVMLQSLKNEENSEYYAALERGEIPSQSTDPRVLAEIMSFQETGVPSSAPSGLKSWGIIAAAIALFYVVLGGNK